MSLVTTARLHSSLRCCYWHIRSRQHPTIMESEDSVPCSPIYISWATWIQLTLVFCLLSIRSDIIPCMRLGIPISYVGDIDYNCLYCLSDYNCIFISHLLQCPTHLILLTLYHPSSIWWTVNLSSPYRFSFTGGLSNAAQFWVMVNWGTDKGLKGIDSAVFKVTHQ
jgi:hypothetical protein